MGNARERKISLFKPYVNKKALRLVSKTLRSGYIGEGPRVKEFEEKIGQIVGSNFTIALNSGTSSLYLALIIAGIKPEDEVITTAQTMLATTQAILAVGAKPVYADVCYRSGNINPSDIVRRITSKTKAILTVDWGGYPCDYGEIISLAKKNNLVVIEDAAQAFGATYKGKPIGSVCPYTCFSFQAIKHLTTGDGGGLCLPNKKDYGKALRLRWFGIDRVRRKPSILGEPIWNVTELGYKFHMNDIAASIGLGNLEDLDLILDRRRQIVKKYRRRLKNIAGITLFEKKKDRESANWLFSIHVEKREDFCRMMRSFGIEVSVVHLRIDRNKICGRERKDLPQLDKFTKTHICLPLHNFLSKRDVEYIIKRIKSGW